MIEEDAKSMLLVNGGEASYHDVKNGNEKSDKYRILVSRVVVVIVVLVSAAAVSTSAYKLLKRDELEDFENQVSNPSLIFFQIN